MPVDVDVEVGLRDGDDPYKLRAKIDGCVPPGLAQWVGGGVGSSFLNNGAVVADARFECRSTSAAMEAVGALAMCLLDAGYRVEPRGGKLLVREAATRREQPEAGIACVSIVAPLGTS